MPIPEELFDDMEFPQVLSTLDLRFDYHQLPLFAGDPVKIALWGVDQNGKDQLCCAPLYKGCPKYHGHKGDPKVTLGTCGAGGENDQVIVVWVRAPGVENASHPRGLGVMRVRP